MDEEVRLMMILMMMMMISSPQYTGGWKPMTVMFWLLLPHALHSPSVSVSSLTVGVGRRLIDSADMSRCLSMFTLSLPPHPTTHQCLARRNPASAIQIAPDDVPMLTTCPTMALGEELHL
jgi:hypothetical protein